MAIDYGRKRCGVAVTDVLKICANALGTVASATLLDYIKTYVAQEPVERIVVGNPTQLNVERIGSMRYITPFVNKLRKEMPEMPITMYDERFTSSIAHQAMIDGGMKKSDRRDKAKVDSIAATIILTDFLESKLYKTL